MRLPRFRCKLATFLLAVAIFAVNFRFLQYAEEIGVFRLGMLPLANVAVIGALRLVTRKIRAYRTGVVADPGSSTPRFTFFSVHFLVLAGVAYCFASDVVNDCESVAGDACGTLGSLVRNIPGAEEIDFPIAVEVGFLGVFLSGPPLLVCWIGHALASRLSKTLSVRRIRLLAGQVSLIFVITELSICFWHHPFSERKNVTVEFQIFDKDSGSPIAWAFVRMIDRSYHGDEDISQSAFSDSSGHVRLTSRFDVAGQRNAFQTLGGFWPWGHWLEVSADRYRSRQIPLTEVVGPYRDLTQPREFRVVLSKGTDPQSLFADLAGTYFAQGGSHGAPSLQILADGRFDWSSAGRWDTREYGYVKKIGQEIQLQAIPEQGRETSPYVTFRYIPFEWGKRRYLCPDEESLLRQLCRFALTRSSRYYAYPIYLRQTDFDKPLFGLPRLPWTIWLKYLSSELSLKDDQSILRIAIDSIVSRKPENRRRPRTIGPD